MITKENLEEIGFVITKDPVFPMEKVLGNDEEGGKLALVITQVRNKSELAIVMPTGDLLYMNGAESLEDIKLIEKWITEFEPNF